MDHAISITKDKLDPKFELTKTQFFKTLSLSQTSFTAYKRRSEPTSGVLKRLATPLGFNTHWLITGEGEQFANKPDIEEEQDVLAKPCKIQHIADESRFTHINPTLLEPLTMTEHIRFDVVVTRDIPSIAFNDDLILLDITQTVGEGVFLMEINRNKTVRRVLRLQDNDIKISSNQNELELKQDQVKILGKVVWRAGRV